MQKIKFIKKYNNYIDIDIYIYIYICKYTIINNRSHSSILNLLSGKLKITNTLIL